ncbi:MAG: prepilin peptidase [Methanoregulaceae archaeon]|nr:prepilin peptidase [Methanoregulaceae archaeon]
MILPLVFTSFVMVVTLLYASVLDYRDRRVPFRTWYPAIITGIPAIGYLYLTFFLEARYPLLAFCLIFSVIFSIIFYLFAYFNLFGGADAWAFIFITLFIPLFPVTPLLGQTPLGYFPFSVLTNAVILNLFVPVGIFLYNISRGNRAPAHYLFFGFPVSGKTIRKSHGFVMEDIADADGTLQRRFIPARDLMVRALRGQRTTYTRDLRQDPEKYRDEIALYERAGHVWILYGIPFIIPITAGVIMALCIGDLIFIVLSLV